MGNSGSVDGIQDIIEMIALAKLTSSTLSKPPILLDIYIYIYIKYYVWYVIDIWVYKRIYIYIYKYLYVVMV